MAKIERLPHKRDSTILNGFGRKRHVTASRHHDDGDRGVDPLDVSQQMQTAHAWQHDVEQHEIGTLPPHDRKRLSRFIATSTV